MTDRLYAIATERNRDPILAALRRILPAQGNVLEIASGSGEHVVHFAQHLPGLVFQPSDPDERNRASVAAWTAQAQLPNVRPPLVLDALALDWNLDDAFAADLVGIVCINMIHISPWGATLGLLRHASALLRPRALLYLYGPYMRDGQHTAPSNAAFDENLRSRNPQWGVRNLETVQKAAAAKGLSLREVVPMPANNLSVIFERDA